MLETVVVTVTEQTGLNWNTVCSVCLAVTVCIDPCAVLSKLTSKKRQSDSLNGLFNS